MSLGDVNKCATDCVTDPQQHNMQPETRVLYQTRAMALCSVLQQPVTSQALKGDA